MAIPARPARGRGPVRRGSGKRIVEGSPFRLADERLTENELSDPSLLWHDGCADQSTRHNVWTKITRPKYERARQRYSSDLTDAEWAVIEPHMPAAKRLGRPRETEATCSARVSTIASQSLRGKGIASLSRACTAKVRLAKDPYAEGAPGRLGARWPRGRDHEPRQAILSASRPHQASPGEVLCGGGGGRTAWHRGAPDRAQTLCRWRRGCAVLPEASPRATPRVDRDGGAALSVGADGARDCRARRGAASVGGEPRVHRLEPAPGARRRPRASRRVARRSRPRTRRELGLCAAGDLARARRSRRARVARLAQDLGLAWYARQRAYRAPLEFRRGATRGAGSRA